MRLGGWSRIGVVLSVLYGVLVIVFAYESRPTQERVEEQWFDEAAEVIAESLSKSENKEVTPYRVRELVLKHGDSTSNIELLKKIADSPSGRQVAFSRDIAAVNNKFLARLEALPNDRRRHVMASLAWWLGGTLLLFGVGWTIRWIYHGFARPAA